MSQWGCGKLRRHGYFVLGAGKKNILKRRVHRGVAESAEEARHHELGVAAFGFQPSQSSIQPELWPRVHLDEGVMPVATIQWDFPQGHADERSAQYCHRIPGL